MRAMRWLAAIMMVATLAGCAALESPVTKGQRLVGSDQSAVQAQFGPPRESYPLDGGTRWLYPTQPYGQFTYAADFDASGKRLTSAGMLDYAFSKRTDVYAEVDYTRLQGAWIALNSAAAFNNSGNTYGNNSRLGVMLGVRHKF